MEIVTILISVIAIIISSLAIYYSYNVNITQKKLFADGKIKQTLTEDLEKYYKLTKESIDKYSNVINDIRDIKDENMKNLYSIVIKRFNPYEEAGGDLSFCTVILNREKNGIMITSLHGRDRTRIYGKNVVSGEINGEMLFDEKETLFDALKLK